MKIIAMVMTSALLTVGLIPLGSAQDNFGSAQEGIEVITVVGKRPTQAGIQEGIEVITVVGKRPAPTVARTCVNEVMAGRADARTPESRHANRDSLRQAIKDCIDQAQS